MNMKRILILLLGLFSVAYGQFSPTSAKSAFKWGVSIGTRDSTAYAANDSLVVVINRQGRLMYRSTDGYWKLLANAASSDYVPYTGAVDNVALGNFRLTARSLKADSVYANGSGGAVAVTNSGTRSFSWGAGGSSEVTFYGFAGYDANRASSYTARSFTDKNYVDSSAALRVRYTDTAAMLYPYLRRTDSTGLLSQVVRTFGTQTIGGNKTFSNDIVVNSMRVGLGGGTQPQNVALGLASLNSNTTGTFNTSIGFQSLFDNTTAANNTAVGSQSLTNLTTGSNNIGIGVNAGSISAGSADLTTNTNSIFLGSNTKALANGNTNEIVIGDNTTGNGSNTVTIGNSSVTDNYFKGNLRAGGAILTGPLNGTSLSMSGGGSFGANTTINTASGGALILRYTGNTNYGEIATNAANELIFKPNVSEAGRFASDGTFLINTTTTDGTNKLIVNGGVKANGTINANSTGSNIRLRADGTDAKDGFVGAATDGTLYFRHWDGASGIIISSTGAATFSSSVTAQSGTFDKTSTGSNYLLVKALNSSSNDIATAYTDGTNSVYSGMMRGTAGSADAAYHIWTGGAIRQTISSTGAATFSSSVTATTYTGATTTVSSSTTIADGIETVFVNNTGVTTITVTLPSASGKTGRTLKVVRTAGGLTSNVNVTSVNGGTHTLRCLDAIELVSDGTSWRVVAKYLSTECT